MTSHTYALCRSVCHDRVCVRGSQVLVVVSRVRLRRRNRGLACRATRASLSLDGRLHALRLHVMLATTPAPTTVKELTQDTLQANKDHQYALKVYTERLEADLEAVDKLLVSVEL